MKTFLANLLAPLIAITTVIANPLKVGDQAPDFTLKDAEGQEHTLTKQLKESKVALLFYRSGDW